MAEQQANFLDLLDELLNLPQSERQIRLDELNISSGDRADLERCLRHGDSQCHESTARSFLETPPLLLRQALRFMGSQAGMDSRSDDPAGRGGGDLSAELLECIESAAPPSLPGYEVLRPVGAGGMGTVWLARQLATGRDVALKVMAPWLLGSTSNRIRFGRELRFASRLENPGIARVYDGGTAGGVCYYAMEWIEGGHLDRYVIKNKVSTPKILELFRKICLAVQHAHQKGIIHCDLKPSNILIDKGGEPHILDFGLARAMDEAGDGQAAITRQGALAGTLALMSPEQASGQYELLDVRTDVYGLAATLYLILLGRPPHSVSPARHDLLRRVAAGEIDRPRRIQRGFNADLEALLLKALAPDPEKRYASAGELAAEVERFLRGQPLMARRPTRFYVVRKWARRHAFPLSAAVLVLAMLSGIGIYAYVRIDRARADAVGARAKFEQQARAAKAAARDAEIGRGDALTSVGDARAAGGQWADAADAYHHAFKILSGLGADCDRVDFALLLAYGNARPPLMEFEGHQAEVRCVAISPDGRTAATGDDSGIIRLWDPPTGRLFRTLTGGPNSVRCITFSRDGGYIASADEQLARMWDLRTGVVREYEGLGKFPGAISFSSDGRYLAASGYLIPVWDREKRAPIAVLSVGSPAMAAFSPVDSTLWIGSSAGGLFRADAANLSGGPVLMSPSHGNCISIAASPDGCLVAVGTQGDGVQVIRAVDGSVAFQMAAREWVVDVGFSADGRQLFANCGDHTLRRWVIEGQLELPAVFGAGYHRAAWSKDDWAVIAGMNGAALVDFALQAEVAEFRQLPGEARASVSDDGLLLAAGTSAGALSIWDMATGRKLASGSEPWSRFGAVAFAPNSSRLAFADNELIYGWDPSKPDALRVLGHDDEEIKALAFSPDASRILSATSLCARLWLPTGEKPLWTYYTPTVINPTAALTADSSTALLVSARGFTIALNASTGRACWDPWTGGRWSPQTRTTFTSMGNPAYRKSIAHSESDFRLRYSGQYLQRDNLLASVSSDDRWGISHGANQTPKLWDIQTGTEIAAINDGRSPITTASFAAGHRLMVVADGSGVCAVRDLARAATYRQFAMELPAARSALRRNPNDPAALMTLGRWHVFRGRWRWAAELLQKSRAAGGGVSALDLARCYWQLNDLTRAREEFKRAIEHAEAPAAYLRLCIKALGGPIALPLNNPALAARRGQFEVASAEYERRINLAPASHWTWCRASVLRLWLGDEDGFRNHCRRMYELFRESEENGAVHSTVRLCLLIPGVIDDPKTIVAIADDLLKREHDTSWPWQAAGLARLRTGDFAEALRCFGEALYQSRGNPRTAAESHCLLAITHQRLGKLEDARRSLDRAKSLIEQLPTAAGGDLGADWDEWIICRLMFRAAQTAVGTDIQ